jgi:hypothetical protein
MRYLPQKLMTLGLLAVYGSIAVLGHGLHEFSSAHHHHHHVAAGQCAGHQHDHCHGHSRAAAPAAQNSLADSHDCEICVFLDQIRSDQPQLCAEIDWQPFAVDVPCAAPRNHSQAPAGLHVARGPPALFG